MNEATAPSWRRRATARLRELALEEPVLAVHGPRSVGKSTLLREYAATMGVDVIDLDDPVVRDAVQASPVAAVGGRRPVCIDEFQNALAVLDAIKARLSREGALPGTAVLTGSTRHDALPREAQALTGRLHRFTILPLSQGELGGVDEDLIESLRLNPDETVSRHPSSATTRTEYVARIVAGGFPLALNRSETARHRWFDDYVRTSVERDAVELARVRQRHILNEVLHRLAGQTAQVLNVTALSSNLQTERKTVEGYVRLLEDLFLITRLPAWGKTLNTRATGSPKIHVVDSGLAARLLRLGQSKLEGMDPTSLSEFGHLLETFVVGELQKQVSWMTAPVTTGHWRTSDGDEVDFVIEFDDGAVVAFEVKAGERVRGPDLRGLRKLRDALGTRFVGGVALSLGSRSYTYEDKLHVMPVDRLWRRCAPGDATIGSAA